MLLTLSQRWYLVVQTVSPRVEFPLSHLRNKSYISIFPKGAHFQPWVVLFSIWLPCKLEQYNCTYTELWFYDRFNKRKGHPYLPLKLPRSLQFDLAFIIYKQIVLACFCPSVGSHAEHMHCCSNTSRRKKPGEVSYVQYSLHRIWK